MKRLKYFEGKQAKGWWRVVALVAAVAIVASTSPFGVFAKRNDVTTGGSGGLTLVADEADPDMVLSRTSATIGESVATLGLSTIVDAMKRQEGGMLAPIINPRAASVLSGQNFSIDLGLQYAHVPSLNYQLPDNTTTRNLHLLKEDSAITDVFVHMRLPEGVEYVEPTQDSSAHGKLTYDSDTRVVTAQIANFSNQSGSHSVAVTLRTPNGNIPNNTSLQFSSWTDANLDIVTAYRDLNQTTATVAEHHVYALDHPEVGYPVGGSCTVDITAGDDWGLEKVAGTVTKDGTNEDNATVTFTFDTNTGLLSGTSLDTDPTSPATYLRHGRLFFAADGYHLSESLQLFVTGEGVTGETHVSVRPDVKITYNLPTGNYAPQSSPDESDRKLLPGLSWSWTSAWYSFFNGTYCHWLTPNSDLARVGYSPSYTSYTVTMTFKVSDLRAAASSAGITSDAFTFGVKSKADFNYTLIGEDSRSLEDSAQLTVPIAKKGSTITVFEYLYPSYLSTNPSTAVPFDKNQFSGRETLGFQLYKGNQLISFAPTIQTDTYNGKTITAYMFEGLEPGTYTVKRTGAIDGYVFKENSPQQVTVTLFNSAKADFYAWPVPSYSFQMFKTKSTVEAPSAPFPGVEFALYPKTIGGSDTFQTVKNALTQSIERGTKPTGERWQFATTRNDRAKFDQLPTGEYYVIELRTDVNRDYVVNNTVYTFDTVRDAESGKMEINGAYVCDSNGGRTTDRFGTSSKPVVNVKDAGSIKITKRVARGEVLYAGPVLETANKPQKEEFQFELLNKDQQSFSPKKLVYASTDKLDNVVFQDLVPGIYYIREIITDGWVSGIHDPDDSGKLKAGDTVGPFVVEAGKVTSEAGGKQVIFTNIPDTSWGIIQKVDEKGDGMPQAHSAKFKIYEEDPDNPLTFSGSPSNNSYYYDPAGKITELETGWFGVLLISGLDPDRTYVAKETEVPKGYAPPENPKTEFKVHKISNPDPEALREEIGAYLKDPKNRTQIVNVKTGKLAILKSDSSTNVALDGATFQLYVRDGEAFKPYLVDGQPVSGTTGTDGKVTFDPDLPNQDYYIVETVPPANYKPATAENYPAGNGVAGSVDVTIDGQTVSMAVFGPFKIGETGTIKNHVASEHAYVRFNKLDKDNTSLSGGKFTVRYVYENGDIAYLRGEYSQRNKNDWKPMTLEEGKYTFFMPYNGIDLRLVMPEDAVPQPDGTFRLEIEELEAPPSCVLPPDPKDRVVSVTSGRELSLAGTASMINLRNISVTLQKYLGPFGSTVSPEQPKAYNFTIYESADGVTFRTKTSSVPLNYALGGFRPGYHYYVEELGVSEGTFLGVSCNGQNIPSTSITLPVLTDYSGTPIGNNRTIVACDITEFVREGNDITINAYNKLDKVSVKINKTDLEGNPISITGATFALYRITDGKDYTRATAEELSQLSPMRLGEDYQPIFGPTSVTYNGITLSEAGNDQFLVVETAPPKGYVLIPEAYPKDNDFYACTRAQGSIDFTSGKTELSVTLKNAPESTVNVTDIGLQVQFTAPEGKHLEYPLQEYADGKDIALEIQNNTTFAGKSLNAVPLYDYTIDKVGALEFYSDEACKSSLSGEYELRTVKVPAGSYSEGTPGAPVSMTVYAYGADGGEIRHDVFGPGESAHLSYAAGSGVRWVKVAYYTEGGGPVGLHFVARAISVEAHLARRTDMSLVRGIRSESKISFTYYPGYEVGNRESKSARSSDQMTVAESRLMPKVQIAKSAQTEDGKTAVQDGSLAVSREDVITFTITASVINADLKNAVIVDPLPPHFDLDRSSIEVTASGSKSVMTPTRTSVDGRREDCVVVKIDSIPKNESVTITFKARFNDIAEALPSQIVNTAYITSDQPLIAASGANQTGQTFQNNNSGYPVPVPGISPIWSGNPDLGYLPVATNLTLRSDSGVSLIKFVRGAKDSDFKYGNTMAYTTNGGDIVYQIVVTNLSAYDYKDVRLGDLLPIPGDGEDRNSQWRPVLTIREGKSAPVYLPGSSAESKLYLYRGAITGSAVSAATQSGEWNGWSNETTDLAEVTAFGLEVSELGKGQSLTVEFTMKAPALEGQDAINERAGQEAVNRVYLQAYNANTKLPITNMVTTSNMVKVTVNPTVSLGNRVWLDLNGNGVQDAGEHGIEGVDVTLERFANGNLESGATETVSTNTDGFYRFSDIMTYKEGDPDRFSYRLRFQSPPNGLRFTQSGAGSYKTDSDADSSGTTPLFSFKRVGETIQVEYGGDSHTFGPGLDGGYGSADPKPDDYTDETFDCGYTLERDIEINKTDMSGAGITGAKFALTSAAGEPIIRTSQGGAVVFDQLDLLTNYTLRETMPADGYSVPAPGQPLYDGITFPGLAITSYTLEGIGEAAAAMNAADHPGNAYTNEKAGGIKIIKTGESPDSNVTVPLEVTFTLTGNDIDPITLKTDKTGEAVATGLIPGTYTLTELPESVPSGYKPIEPQEITILEGSEMELTTISIVNELVGKGRIGITKVKRLSESQIDLTATLSGAEFGVFANETDTEAAKTVDRLTTAADGTAVSKELAAGEYWVRELNAPIGYAKLMEPIHVIVPGDGSTVQIEPELTANSAGKGRLRIEKVAKDGDGNVTAARLDGATFEIYSASNALVGAVTTANGGEAISEELDWGVYTLRETVAPEGYVINPLPVEVTIGPGSDIVQVPIEATANSPVAVPISITKTIEGDGHSLVSSDRFTFTLYGVTDGVVDTSRALGKAELTGAGTAYFFDDGSNALLHSGEYAIGETVEFGDKTDSGAQRYSLRIEGQPIDPGEYYRFTVDSSAREIQLNAANSVLRGSISITKALSGNGTAPIHPDDTFTFAVYQAKGTSNPLVDQATIRVGETLTFSDLPIGKYIITETSMPSGYQWAGWNDLSGDDSYANPQLLVNVMENGQTLRYQAVNRVMPGQIYVQKELRGASTSADRRARFTFALYEARRDAGGVVTIPGGSAAQRQTVRGGETASFGDLKPGVYAIEELDRSGYTFVGYRGDGEDMTAANGQRFYVVEVTGDNQTPVRVTVVNRTEDNDRPDDPRDPDRPSNPRTPDDPNYNTNNDPPQELIDLPDEPVPLAQDPLIDLPDQPVPLAMIPDMGGFSLAHLIPIGGILIAAGLFLTRRKKEE